MKKTAIALATSMALLSSAAVMAAGAPSGKDPLATALDHYKAELVKAERAAGYIGPKAYIPEEVKVTDGIYTVVGSLIWHNPTNYGLNNNLSFIEFEDGVFVFNAGANAALAQAFHEIIKKHTNKPVKWVAVENHQGHAHLGASYWYDMGVRNFYSQARAHQDFSGSWDDIKARWSKAVGHELTAPAYNISDKFTTFEDKMEVDVGGGEKVVLFYNGPGHTPGATIAYVPSRNVIFPGDLAYNSRMLALFSYTDTFEWVKTFERFMETTPEGTIIVPGHGGVTDMATVKRDTYDYLKWLQAEVQKVVDNGGTEMDAENIDQSQFKHREVYEQTHRGNARHIYREITGGSLGSALD
jgi:glyoxylase-like metal-dependent hydrolase (beta-lactamase superfamily II)